MFVMHTAERVIATLRAHEEELRQAGLRSLSLLGSVARGETEMDSEIDLCSLVVRLAAENVASTSVSFAPVAARNTPRKRCPLAGSFENGFCFIYCLNSFGGTIG